MYACKLCNYQTTDKSNYNKHLNTKKHIQKLKTTKEITRCFIIEKNDENMSQNEPKMSQNEPKMSQNEPKRAKHEPKMSQNEPKMSQNEPVIFEIKNSNSQNSICQKIKNPDSKNSQDSGTIFKCAHCDRVFSTKANMRRHELHRCRFKKKLQDKIAAQEQEKKKLYKHIERLLEENGRVINNNSHNTTNNTVNNIQQTNNIVIKNFGEEDMSHITSQVLDKLICAPGNMINNLTKMIHFNHDKPENMNMYIPSRKQKFIKVFRKNKWMLEKKHERIPDIVDRNYNIIDNYYEEGGGGERLQKQLKRHYESYQKLIDNKDDRIIKQEYDACELEILNNSEKVMDQHKLNN